MSGYRVHAEFAPAQDGLHVEVRVRSQRGASPARSLTLGLVPRAEAGALRAQVRALRTVRLLTVRERYALLLPLVRPGTRPECASCASCEAYGHATTFAEFEALAAPVRACLNFVFWDLDAWRCVECLAYVQAPTTSEEES